MAEQEAPAPAEGAKKKDGNGRRLLLVVAGIMLLEGAAVVAFLRFTAPPSARANELGGLAQADGEALREVELIHTRFQNVATGRVWDWETEIHLKVRVKHQGRVEEMLENRKAEIHEGLARIFRKAQHSHLREAGLQTITRQIEGYVHEVFGADPATGETLVERVIMPKCDGYPADF